MLSQRPLEYQFARHTLIAPNGTVVELVDGRSALEIPECRPELVVTCQTGDDAWIVGRAGMRYWDLLPGRYGGRFICLLEVALPGDGGGSFGGAR